MTTENESQKSRNGDTPVRRAQPYENLIILKARLWDAMSPAERREIDEAIEILRESVLRKKETTNV